MSEQQPCRRSKISTVVAPETVELTERAAEERRTTPSQVMRVLIEDGAKRLAGQPGGLQHDRHERLGGDSAARPPSH